jgi:hypothetical protein
MKPFINSMIARRPPIPLSGISLAALDGIEPSECRKSLERSLEIASISSPDLHKQIAVIRETLHLDDNPTSFGIAELASDERIAIDIKTLSRNRWNVLVTVA